jgi:aspartyl-tRNA(Asn)/glutamyl-tRNA(Gln) amidotransferase subunit B
MPLPYTTVIGLEVHVQLLTRTKLFCGCHNKFGLPPNSATCPVCLGLPGALPVMNRRAFELALRAGLALNGSIARFTKWDRKNYYYPDLPKNYQISQYDLPFCDGGWLEINVAADPRRDYQPKRVGLIRVHLEEDAGKLLHDESGAGGDSRVDLNRAGTPLLEIVSQPAMNRPAEAAAYLTELRLMLRELGVSDCEMQEGSLRCDANVNVHVPQADGPVAATPIVEIKNLNSIRAVERAIDFEARRQFEEFRQNGRRLGEAPKATAGWDDARGETRIQRRKEEASDYRYFPDPDLLPVVFDDAWLQRVGAEVGELPAAQRQRLVAQYALSLYDADVLARQGRAGVAYFEAVAAAAGDAKAACNWITNKVLATGQPFAVPAANLAALIQAQKAMGLTKQISEAAYDLMLAESLGAAAAIDRLGVRAVDADQLRAMVRRAIAANAKAVEDFRKGKVAALGRIKGAVMKEAKGAAKPEAVDQMLAEELANESAEGEPSAGAR